MKTIKTLALIGGLGLLAGAALAQPSPRDNSAPQPPQDRSGAGRPDPEMRRKMLLEKYDANKDGRLDDTERAAIGRDVEEGKFGPPQGMNRRGPDGQGGPGFGGGPRAQGPGGFDGDRPPAARGQGGASAGGAPRGQGPGGFDGERPPRVGGQGGGNFDGPQPPRAPREGQQPFGQGGGREGGDAAHRAPMPDREGGPERGQFGPGPGGPGGQGRELGRNAIESHRREFIKKYDVDGDGKLNSAEREAIGRDIEEGKLPPPPLAPQPPREPREPRQPQPPRSGE